jgi:probable rRNA maturation factor
MINLEPPRGMDEVSAWKATKLSRAGLTRFLRTAQSAVGIAGEVSVLLADDRFLRRLNREFRAVDKPTDVLSFAAPDDMRSKTAGDLAISLETAARQAAEHGHTLRDELRILMLHGLLHLNGMDHESDKGEMARREAALRRSLRLPTTLIERAGQQKTAREAKASSGLKAVSRTKAASKTKVAKTRATSKKKAAGKRAATKKKSASKTRSAR